MTVGKLLPRGDVVLIPGIMGSSLEGADGDLWGSDFLHNYWQLTSNPTLLHWQGRRAAAQLIEGIRVWHLPVTFTLWGPVIEKLGSAGFTVQRFGYDWRESLLSSSEHLVDWLRERLDPPYRLVTHSMGGLLVRVAIGLGLLRPTAIETLIHVGSPLRGAPSAFAALCGAPSLPLLQQVLRYRYRWRVADYRKILHDAILTFPSVYQLLPEEDHYLLRGTTWFNPLAERVLSDASMTAANAVHDALRVAEQRLTGHPGVFAVYTTSSDSHDTPLGYRIEVVDDGRPHYRVTETVSETREGDGTVPATHAVMPSAMPLPVCDVGHSFLCTSRRVAAIVTQTLTARSGG